jgi:DinB superfamily
MARPDLSRVPEFYHGYINAVTEKDLMPALLNQTTPFFKLLKKIPAEKHNYRYAKGKWTIKEMLQHMIDTERIFAYRALCIARQETASLPGFDENQYAENSKANKRNWNDLVAEFKAVRQSTEILFASFDKKQLDSNGISNGRSVYVLGIGFVIVGHVNHHVKILHERYLSR